jgi:hypothetical protein
LSTGATSPTPRGIWAFVVSTVTKRIKRLEDELAVPLIEPDSGGFIDLTAAGRRFVQVAPHLLHAAQTARRAPTMLDVFYPFWKVSGARVFDHCDCEAADVAYEGTDRRAAFADRVEVGSVGRG